MIYLIPSACLHARQQQKKPGPAYAHANNKRNLGATDGASRGRVLRLPMATSHPVGRTCRRADEIDLTTTHSLLNGSLQAGQFTVAPQPGGLEFCEGSLAFGQGRAVLVRWNVSGSSSSPTAVGGTAGVAGSKARKSMRLMVDSTRSVRGRACWFDGERRGG